MGRRPPGPQMPGSATDRYGFVNHFYAMRPGHYKFGKITQNKGHFAVYGHSRSPILVPNESSYKTSYQNDS